MANINLLFLPSATIIQSVLLLWRMYNKYLDNMKNYSFLSTLNKILYVWLSDTVFF